MRFLRAHASGVLAGALAAAIGLEIVFLASALRLLPFAPFAFALAIVDVMPGFVSSALIDLLQFWAKRILEIAVVLFALGAGALGGAMASAGTTRGRVLLVAAIPWALDVAAALTPAGRQFDPTGTAIAGVVGVGSYAAGLNRLLRALAIEAAGATGRRRALVAAGALVLLLGSGGMLLASLGRRGAAAARALVLPKPPVVSAPPLAPEDPAFDATPGLSPQLTSNRDFYVVDTAALFKPTIEQNEWRLKVEGEVERPYQLTYDEFLAMDAVEQVETIECISNPIGGELISTAKWTGVRVIDILTRAGLKEGSFDLVMESWDGYSDSIPIRKALEPTTLVAYGMNDDVLPVEHGFPARMLVPDIYGMKHVKWVARLAVANFDYKGYWQSRGWSDPAVVNTMARIDVPVRTVRWTGGPVRIAGIAFAGARGIQKVEVSTDQGRSWRVASLGREVNAFTWRRWYFDWVPDGPGEARLMVRALDGKDVPQASVRREPFPQGATGYHVVPIRVEKA